MILPLYNKWTIILTTFFGPIIAVPLALLFTYWSFTSTKTVWVFLFIVNIIIGISGLIALLISRTARFFFVVRILYSLGFAVPLAFAVFLITKPYFPNLSIQICAIPIIILLVEGFISFNYEKNRLTKSIIKGISIGFFDIELGIVDLQKPFVVAQRDSDRSIIETILAIGRIVFLFAPVFGNIIYQSNTYEQQTNYILVVLSMLVMVSISGSGVSGGTLSALMDYEVKKNMRFAMKKLE